MEVIMMKCGHSANAAQIKNGKQIPYCLVCDCAEPLPSLPDLTGRKARCFYYNCEVGRHNETYYPKLMRGNLCGSEVNSDAGLPFFAHKPDKPYDEFYCGCHSWD